MLSRDEVRRRVRRTVLRHRRLLAAVLTAVAVGSAVQAVRPPAPPSAPATRDRPSLGARLAAARPGVVALPVRLPDAAMAGLLERGDQVTVLATEASGAAAATTAVASGVEILDLPRDPGAADRVTTGAAGRLVIIGVAPSEVERVTHASVSSVLTFSWDR